MPDMSYVYIYRVIHFVFIGLYNLENSCEMVRRRPHATYHATINSSLWVASQQTNVSKSSS